MLVCAINPPVAIIARGVFISATKLIAFDIGAGSVILKKYNQPLEGNDKFGRK